MMFVPFENDYVSVNQLVALVSVLRAEYDIVLQVKSISLDARAGLIENGQIIAKRLVKFYASAGTVLLIRPHTLRSTLFTRLKVQPVTMHNCSMSVISENCDFCDSWQPASEFL
ncbi:hypothetical protein Plhal304r1_c052g0135971 [Plasmopara halstedii]